MKLEPSSLNLPGANPIFSLACFCSFDSSCTNPVCIDRVTVKARKTVEAQKDKIPVSIRLRREAESQGIKWWDGRDYCGLYERGGGGWRGGGMRVERGEGGEVRIWKDLEELKDDFVGYTIQAFRVHAEK